MDAAILLFLIAGGAPGLNVTASIRYASMIEPVFAARSHLCAIWLAFFVELRHLYPGIDYAVCEVILC